VGYLAVYAAQASLAATLKDNATEAKLPAGRLSQRKAGHAREFARKEVKDYSRS
jgi:hypothetical protein